MTRVRAALILALLCAAATPIAAQTRPDPTVALCQNTTVRRLLASNPHTDSITFLPAPNFWMSMNKAAGVTGNAMFRRRGLWQSFQYSCFYDMKFSPPHALVELSYNPQTP